MTDDRRGAPRHAMKLEAEIDLGDGPIRSALTRDASERGVLLMTNTDLDVGREVTLRCHVDSTLITAVGTVVRSEPCQGDEWRTVVAIRLSAANPLVAEIFRQLAIRESRPPAKLA